MRRENRYWLAKARDVNRYLTPEEAWELKTLLAKVDDGRVSDGKHPMQCVVVECDWPEYEQVWAMIEARMDSKAGEEQHTTLIERLERLVEKLKSERDISWTEYGTGGYSDAIRWLQKIIDEAKDGN